MVLFIVLRRVSLISSSWGIKRSKFCFNLMMTLVSIPFPLWKPRNYMMIPKQQSFKSSSSQANGFNFLPLYCNQVNSSEPNVLLEKRTNRGKFRIWTARETLAEGRKKKVKDSDLAFITKNKPHTKSKDEKNKLLISPKWKVLNATTRP